MHQSPRKKQDLATDAKSYHELVDVKLKRTMKERFSSFANQLRDVFGIDKP